TIHSPSAFPTLPYTTLFRSVRKAATYIAAHADAPITLSRLAQHVGTSPFHLQRTFSRLLGISPRAYQDALRAQRLRTDLRRGKRSEEHTSELQSPYDLVCRL